MMKLMLSAAAVIAVAAAGYAAGTYRSVPAAVVRETQAAKPSGEAPLTRADIAAIVRGELAAQVALPVPAPIAAASAASPSVAAADRQEAPKRSSNPGARAGAETVLNDAIHFGTWTDHDRALMKEQLEQLGPDDWLGVTAALSVAINSGKLRVETDGMPF